MEWPFYPCLIRSLCLTIIRHFSQFDYLSSTAQRLIFFTISPAFGRRNLYLQPMITISEKIIHTSWYQVKLYKQGMFWVGYEQSAYYIWQLKGFKPTKKWLKNIKSEVVQVGFPNVDDLLNVPTLKIVPRKKFYLFRNFNSYRFN